VSGATQAHRANRTDTLGAAQRFSGAGYYLACITSRLCLRVTSNTQASDKKHFDPPTAYVHCISPYSALRLTIRKQLL